MLTNIFYFSGPYQSGMIAKEIEKALIEMPDTGCQVNTHSNMFSKLYGSKTNTHEQLVALLARRSQY